MRSQMLYTNGSFEICQVWMFVKQRRTHGWSSYLPGKNIFVPKQKSSNLYIIMFEVSENVSEYVFLHSALVCVHKYFTLTGGLKSAKCECLWSSAEHTAEAVTCRDKNIFILKEKSSNLYIIYVLCQRKRFWVCIYAHCSSMRSQMLCTNGSLEICQERMFVKQRRKHSWSSYLLVALTELRKNVITYIVPRKNRQNFIFAWKIHKNLGLHKKTTQNFTCTWPEHSAIFSSWTLKCNAPAVVVVVAEKMWISQNMLWVPCSNRMSRF